MNIVDLRSEAVDVIAGSTVHIDLASDQPLAKSPRTTPLELVNARTGKSMKLFQKTRRLGTNRATITFPAQQSFVARVRIVAADGIANRPDIGQIGCHPFIDGDGTAVHA